MKQIILFILTLSLFSLNAQIEFSPEENTKDVTLDLSDIWAQTNIKSFLLNNTSTSISLKWEIFKIDAPEEWNFQLAVAADGGGDFPWGVASNFDVPFGSNTPLPIVSNDSSLMQLSIRPNGVAGCGTYEIHVSLTSDTAQTIAIGKYNYIINTTPDCITSNNDFEKKQILIFPNPTSDFFTITENTYVKSIDIFNIVGKKMAYTPFKNGDAINIFNYSNGLYLVRMLDENGDVLKTTRLAKR